MRMQLQILSRSGARESFRNQFARYGIFTRGTTGNGTEYSSTESGCSLARIDIT